MEEDILNRLIWPYVDRQGENECWNWIGPITGRGYPGRVQLLLFHGYSTSPYRSLVHILRGPIPKGLQVDHVCMNKLCMNPAHLEVVTPGENTRRAMKAKHGDMCKKGLHDLNDPNNLVRWQWETNGKRICRLCHNARHAKTRRERYQSDPEYRARERATMQRYLARRAEAQRELENGD